MLQILTKVYTSFVEQLQFNILLFFVRIATKMSEVQGKRSAPLSTTPVDKMYCHVCPTVKATAYCMPCRIYMCPSCVGHHKILPLTASHELLEGDKFPLYYPSGYTENIKQCPDHPEEEIKIYCPSHEALCCCACNVPNHDKCTKQYIPQISKDFYASQEYLKLKEELNSSEDKIKESFANIDTCLKAVKSMNNNAIANFKRYKNLVISYLEQREKELLAQLESISKKDTDTLEELKTTAKTIQSDLSDVKTKVRLHEHSPHDLFIATKRVKTLLTTLQASLNQITYKIGNSYVELQKGQLVEQLLANKNGLMQIITSPGTMVFKCTCHPSDNYIMYKDGETTKHKTMHSVVIIYLIKFFLSKYLDLVKKLLLAKNTKKCIY